MVNLVNSLMIEAIRKGASDVHIESLAEETRVRYRIDGVLQTVTRLEKARFAAVSSRVKIMANLNIMERRLPQDGRISVHLGDGLYDVRVSIVPIVDGESLVLRLFNTEGVPRGLEELGIDGRSIQVLRELVAHPHGLVLATGPTGSGKTTTLNALLREIAVDTVKVITIEDPVEYRIEGVDQIQTNERIGLTFDSLLRRVLRQDPDVIMVGEIRDTPTAELSLRAALTGHLVLSTLHTNDSVSVIPRLRNMGVEPYLLAAVLRGALAQRLVRKVCRGCAQPVQPDAREKKLLEEGGLPTDGLARGVGCDACGRTGYKGRTAVVEVFRSDERVEEMILKGERLPVLTDYLTSQGFRSLARNGLALAASGDHHHRRGRERGGKLMPVYACRVANEKGKVEEFLREAASEESCLREIGLTGRFVLSIGEVPVSRAASHRRSSRRLIHDLTEMLTLTLGAGLSLKDSLEVAQTVFTRGEGNRLVALLQGAAHARGQLLPGAGERRGRLSALLHRHGAHRREDRVPGPGVWPAVHVHEGRQGAARSFLLGAGVPGHRPRGCRGERGLYRGGAFPEVEGHLRPGRPDGGGKRGRRHERPFRRARHRRDHPRNHRGPRRRGGRGSPSRRASRGCASIASSWDCPWLRRSSWRGSF